MAVGFQSFQAGGLFDLLAMVLDDSTLAWQRAREERRVATVLCASARAERRRAEELIEALVTSICRYLDGAVLPHPETYSRRLPTLPPMLRLIRSDLAGWLVEQGAPPEFVTEIILACSEACANAIEHPRAPARAVFEVRAHVAACVLELKVQDYGHWKAGEPEADQDRGRGLAIMKLLMDEVALDIGAESGTTVTMRRRWTGS
jgi:anti-sigma regulatory factor (Ser/Thr protein kinase)